MMRPPHESDPEKIQGWIDEFVALVKPEEDVLDAICRLARRGDWQAIDLFFAGHGTDFRSGREWAAFAHALEHLDAAADELLAVLEDGDGVVACFAGSALASIGDRRAVAPLLDRLSAIHIPAVDEALARGTVADTEWSLLAGALEHLRAREAVDILSAGLASASDEIQTSAAAALGAIGDPRAVPALVEALEPYHAAVSKIDVAEDICWALETIGTKEALQGREGPEGVGRSESPLAPGAARTL